MKQGERRVGLLPCSQKAHDQNVLLRCAQSEEANRRSKKWKVSQINKK